MESIVHLAVLSKEKKKVSISLDALGKKVNVFGETLNVFQPYIKHTIKMSANENNIKSKSIEVLNL